MQKIIYLLLFAGCIICFSCNSKDIPQDSAENSVAGSDISQTEEEAVAVAKSWLALIDSEQYEKSWEETANIFKNAIQKENWGPMVEKSRLKFGKFISRELLSATFTTSLPGVPDGEYVVIQFVSKFEKKEKAVETITPMKGDDNNWHISGYFIK